MANMGQQRAGARDARKNNKASAPQQIIVQRLSSEADAKQVYKPTEPRKFVEFGFDDFTLANLREACSYHYN